MISCIAPITRQFLAPEFLHQRGYGKPVDWWALGCVLYEMLFAENPFETGDLKATFTRICEISVDSSKLRMPEQFVTERRFDADILTRLLTKENNRLGSRNADEVRRTPVWTRGCA